MADRDITIRYYTRSVSSTTSQASGDYRGQDTDASGWGTLTIYRGQSTGQIRVNTYANGDYEGSEQMEVVLNTTSYGRIDDYAGLGTIINNETVPPPNVAPTASATQASRTVTAGQSLALSTLFTWSDGNGPSDIVTFYVRDRDLGGGYLTRSGVKQTENQLYTIPVAEIGQWAYVAGAAGTTSTSNT